MRFVDVKLQCGWPGCDEVGTEGDGDVITRTVVLDGKKPREFDICKKHDDELDDILRPLLEDGRLITEQSKNKKTPSPRRGNDSGTSPSPPSSGGAGADDDDLVCKVPDCNRDGEPLKSKVGLAQHAIRGHGFESLAAYYEMYPPSSSG